MDFITCAIVACYFQMQWRDDTRFEKWKTLPAVWATREECNNGRIILANEAAWKGMAHTRCVGRPL